jgi:hypothetical protein
MENINLKPDLTNPEFEPTDEELSLILTDMMQGVLARAEKAKKVMNELMIEAISEVGGDLKPISRQGMMS